MLSSLDVLTLRDLATFAVGLGIVATYRAARRAEKAAAILAEEVDDFSAAMIAAVGDEIRDQIGRENAARQKGHMLIQSQLCALRSKIDAI